MGLGQLVFPIAVALLEGGNLALIFQAVAVAGFGAFGQAEGMLVFAVGALVLGAAEAGHGQLVFAHGGGVLLL